MGYYFYSVCRALAWFGGLVLVLISIGSVVSIIGRALIPWGLGPIPGDFELVEAGTALAVFSFLPWCHLKRSHAVVDMLWNHYPERLKSALGMFTDILMLVIWSLIVWRMSVGLTNYHENGEVSFILQMPVWWGYAAAIGPALIGCLAAGWRLLETLGVAEPPIGFEHDPTAAH